MSDHTRECMICDTRLFKPEDTDHILPGTYGDMLYANIAHVESLFWRGMSVADMGEAFCRGACWIHRHTSGTWNAIHAVGTDGAHLFLGDYGHAFVIGESRLYRGHIMDGSLILQPGCLLRPQYSRLRPITPSRRMTR